jgi:ribosomal protein L29
MADKKTAEKATKPAAKPAKKPAAKTEKNLQEQLAAKRADLFGARQSLAAGELVNPRVITHYRKEIAQILTKINAEKENK